MQAELDKVTLDLEAKVSIFAPCSAIIVAADIRWPQLAPPHPTLPRALTLPAEGLSSEALSEALTAMSEMPNTQWEDGRVSGAVYHGGDEMGQVWTEAMSKFIVS